MNTVRFENLSEKEQTALVALEQYGSQRKASKALGLSRSAFQDRLYRAKRKLTPSGLAPVETASPLAMTKTTVQYDANGKVIQEWRRMAPSQALAEDVIEELCKKVKGKLKAPKRRPRKTDNEDLCVEIDIYDPHVGMYAEEKETGDGNYDCDIAAKRMMDAVWDLTTRVQHLRPQKVVLVFGGDVMHSDNRSGRTEQSGNDLDVDSRYQRVVKYVVRLMRDVVRVAATVANEVEVVIIKGNHDWHSCVWMREVLEAYTCNCENITVNQEMTDRVYLQWGDNMIGWAHGDRIAANKWNQVVTAEASEMWGKTKFRQLHCGHRHHKKTIAPVQVDECAGLTVRYLPALCPADAWHSSSGYIGSQKGASAFVYHKTRGLTDQLYHNVV